VLKVMSALFQRTSVAPSAAPIFDRATGHPAASSTLPWLMAEHRGLHALSAAPGSRMAALSAAAIAIAEDRKG
jgi:hypothetical protein